MKFPGKRKSKHYFPVDLKGRVPFNSGFNRKGKSYVVGIDQLLVDIEANVSEDFIKENGLTKGQSIVLDDNKAEELYRFLKKENLITGEYPGGAVGNTLHNYSILSDSKSVLLGVINKNIKVGDYAFNYICNTSSIVDLSYLTPCDGQMGKAMCFITPDGERSFGLSIGKMNELYESELDEKLIRDSAALLVTTYTLRDESSPIYKTTLKAVEIANANNIPVILSLGTKLLVHEKKDFLLNFIKDKVSILAMNNLEAYELTGVDDPLLAGEKCLDFIDMALITVGPNGLYLCGYVEESLARMTKDQLHSKSIAEYNKYEYSRPMKKEDCENPIKIYTHINPYMGGPHSLRNTNGAGDGALAALIHDMTSNIYHSEVVPNSPKHKFSYLTYSSLSQISKYANRVSYEVLDQNSPRLVRGLPEREDSLEESYWER